MSNDVFQNVEYATMLFNYIKNGNLIDLMHPESVPLTLRQAVIAYQQVDDDYSVEDLLKHQAHALNYELYQTSDILYAFPKLDNVHDGQSMAYIRNQINWPGKNKNKNKPFEQREQERQIYSLIIQLAIKTLIRLMFVDGNNHLDEQLVTINAWQEAIHRRLQDMVTKNSDNLLIKNALSTYESLNSDNQHSIYNVQYFLKHEILDKIFIKNHLASIEQDQIGANKQLQVVIEELASADPDWVAFFDDYMKVANQSDVTVTESENNNGTN